VGTDFFFFPPLLKVKTEFAWIGPLFGLLYIQHKKIGHFPLIKNKKAGISGK